MNGNVRQSLPIELQTNPVGGGKKECWLVIGGERVPKGLGIFVDRDASADQILPKLLRRVSARSEKVKV